MAGKKARPWDDSCDRGGLIVRYGLAGLQSRPAVVRADDFLGLAPDLARLETGGQRRPACRNAAIRVEGI